ncbi:hypothetical protein HMPREF1170_01599 [Aeromonas veronii AMC35]|nr:hypothetical protein HMPREF1170_01599 [Aeromonas veronii AMC35]
MIRPLSATDLDAAVELWYQASVQAHDFIPAAFWREQRAAMHDIYLPARAGSMRRMDSYWALSPGIRGLLPRCLFPLLTNHTGWVANCSNTSKPNMTGSS